MLDYDFRIDSADDLFLGENWDAKSASQVTDFIVGRILKTAELAFLVERTNERVTLDVTCDEEQWSEIAGEFPDSVFGIKIKKRPNLRDADDPDHASDGDGGAGLYVVACYEFSFQPPLSAEDAFEMLHPAISSGVLDVESDCGTRPAAFEKSATVWDPDFGDGFWVAPGHWDNFDEETAKRVYSMLLGGEPGRLEKFMKLFARNEPEKYGRMASGGWGQLLKSVF